MCSTKRVPIFGLDFLQLVCTLVRCKVRLWPQRLHFVSGYWPFILTRKKALCLFCYTFLLLYCPLFVINAAAQSECDDPETPEHEICTPTPTRELLFKTQTPAPTANLVCPPSLPENWGSLTPDPLWMAQCFGCLLTLTPQVTMTPPDFLITGTPGYTVTQTAIYTPTATLTPNATATPFVQYWTKEYPEQQWCTTPQSGWQYKSIWQLTTASVGNTIRAVKFRSGYSGSRSNLLFKTRQPTNYPNWSINSSISMDNGIQCYNSGHSGDPCNDLFGVSGAQRISYQNDLSGYLEWEIVKYDPTGAECGLIYDIEVAYYGLPETAPTPTVTPTATALPLTDYCAYVDGWGTEPDNSDMLPEITIGENTCYVIFPAFSVSFSALSLLVEIPDFVSPGVQVCGRDVQFGTMSIFGLTFNLDDIATYMGAAAAFFMVIR
jgi:hypothetical protein